ncbi:hypothetical protein ACLOJK_006972 [Asimina triloba]
MEKSGRSSSASEHHRRSKAASSCIQGRSGHGSPLPSSSPTGRSARRQQPFIGGPPTSIG